MPVSVQGEGDAGMPQPLRDNLDVDTGTEQEGGMGMPEVVEPEVGKAGLFQKLAGKVATLYSIGDCVEPRKIVDAIGDGARVGREI